MKQNKRYGDTLFLFLLAEEFGIVFGLLKEEYSSLAKEFGLARKELYSAEKEFGLAKLLSKSATKEFCRL